MHVFMNYMCFGRNVAVYRDVQLQPSTPKFRVDKTDSGTFESSWATESLMTCIDDLH